jgi:hypothetical protein
MSVPSSQVGGCEPPSQPPTCEDETDRGFRNVGFYDSDAGEIPRRISTSSTTRRKFENYDFLTCLDTIDAVKK